MKPGLFLFCVPALLAAHTLVSTPDTWRAAVVRNATVQPLAAGAARIVFQPSERASVEWQVPAAARDFTKARALSFEFESSSTIWFRLGLINRAGQRFEYRVNPWEKTRARAAIAGEYLTRAYMNNQSHQGYMISNWANHIDLTEVVSVELFMAPNEPVTLDFGPLELRDDAVAPEVLTRGPLVDPYGQWKPAEWPGKVDGLPALTARWEQEQQQLEAKPPFAWSAYGGWKEGPRQKAAGFFRSVKLDGRWWLVDPEGYLFWSAGMDCVRPEEPTPVGGREFLYEWLPPVRQGNRGLAYADFYRANIERRYGAEWQPRWKAAQEARLASWGFNTIGNWSHELMFRPARLPYVANAEPRWRGKNWVEFPDVYSAAYREETERQLAAQVAPSAKDPYLIGWFIGNEPRWHDRNLVERILADPEDSATRQFCRRFIAERGDTSKSREDLLETLARAYYRSAYDAIRKADPNHMILGIRYAGSVPEPVLRANDLFDLFSINVYRFEVPFEMLDRIARTLDKPILIGEFHFGAAGRGMAPSLVMVKNQEERGAAYRRYVEKAAEHPGVVGAHWFQHIDQAVTGRFDGELYNLGFVNQQDLPYPEMVQASRETARRIYEVHAGRARAVERQARVR